MAVKEKNSGLKNQTNDERKEERDDALYKDLSEKSTSELEKHFEDAVNDWINSTSTTEKEGVTTYTGGTYQNINHYLRSGKMGSGEDTYLENVIKNASSALSKFKVKENIVVYRKSGDDIFHQLFDKYGEQLEGKGIKLGYGVNSLKDFVKNVNNFKGTVIRDKGFTSSSTKKNVWSGSVWFKIQVPKGTNGAFVKAISHFSGESEFLFNHGTYFKIAGASITKDEFGNEHPVVKLKVVKPSGRKKKG